jgi:phenylacetate-CoA ligase
LTVARFQRPPAPNAGYVDSLRLGQNCAANVSLPARRSSVSSGSALFSSSYYKRSPPWFQEWLIAGRAWARGALRESRSFRQVRAEIEKSQWLQPPEMQRMQADRITAMVRHAATTVPYYRELFLNLGLDASRMEFPRDLHQLPFLTKNDVRKAGMSLVAHNAQKPLVSVSTSGTTGSPVWFHQDLTSITRENAFIWRHLSWAGLKPGEPRAWIRGEPIVPPERVTAPYWRLNRADNMLMLSSLHLSDRNAPGYLEAMARFDPVVIQAYPSSISFLAAWMENRGTRYQGKSLRSVVTSSEMFDREQQEQVARVFGCQVMDWYGLVERVAAIGQCEHGRYHVMTDYSFVEFEPTEEEGLFEPVGTTFNNFSMPLLRYRCADLVRLASPDERCSCGRHMPLVTEIIGRTDDFIKLPDGRRMAACLAGNMFRGVTGILEGQIEQDAIDTLTIRVVPSVHYSPASAEQLLANARKRLGGAVACEVVVVDEIKRPARGKFKAVICRI